jgi:hypothetical protein
LNGGDILSLLLILSNLNDTEYDTADDNHRSDNSSNVNESFPKLISYC